MEKVSREEAIDILKDVVMHTDKLNKDGAPIEVVNAMLKGIEELEKLQKIEEILEKGHKKCIKCDVNCDYFTVVSEDHCEKLIEYDEIEKIFRGE